MHNKLDIPDAASFNLYETVNKYNCQIWVTEDHYREQPDTQLIMSDKAAFHLIG